MEERDLRVRKPESEAAASHELEERSPGEKIAQEGMQEAKSAGEAGTVQKKGGEKAAGREELRIVDDDSEYSFELRGTTLSNAINMIAEAAGVNILLEGDLRDSVNFSLRKVNLNEALDWLCRLYQCRLTQSGGFFIVSRDDPSELTTRIFKLKAVSAKGIADSVKSLVGQEGNVISDDANDILTVTASKSDIEKVEEFLDSTDRDEKQVLIEAKVIEFSLTDLLELGSALDFDNIHIDDTTAKFVTSLLTASQGVDFTVAGDKAKISGAFRTLSKLTRVNLISHPNVIAKNNQEASIDIIKEVPYIESTVTTTGDAAQGVGTSSVESVQFKEVGIKLKVTPSIMNNDNISLAIDQDVSEQIDAFNGVPVVNHRHIITSFSVESKKTILIGGLLKEYVFDENKGVPFLKDVPLLGALFRGTTKTKEKIELVVMITCTIVDASQGGGLPTQTKMEPSMKPKKEEKADGKEGTCSLLPLIIMKEKDGDVPVILEKGESLLSPSVSPSGGAEKPKGRSLVRPSGK